MPRLADHYPPGAFSYDSCDSVGMMGGCGGKCPVLLRGDCPTEEEMIDQIGVWHGPDPEVVEPLFFLIRLQDIA